MDTKLLHIRNKLEFIIRFMMAGDGSFKARLSEAYRHPQFGLRQVPAMFMPAELKKDFEELLDNIDKNENSRVLNEVKMGLMDEVFFFYKKICDLITANVLKEVKDEMHLEEQSDIPTTIVVEKPKKPRKPRAKKVAKD